MHDDAKGYEFQVPQGTKDAQDTKDGVDVYMANVPAPYDIGVMVAAMRQRHGREDGQPKVCAIEPLHARRQDVALEAQRQ